MNSFAQEIMYRLLVLASLFALSNAGVVRVPKIYNALISSDENLAPSHAIPVVEPILTATALGLAFPTIFVHPAAPEEFPKKIETIDDVKKSVPMGPPIITMESNSKDKPQLVERKPIIPELTYHGSLYPLEYDPYVPYTYNLDPIYQTLPYYHRPIFVDLGQINTDNKKKVEQLAHAANFKKNPDIPDVPPPPLPIKDKMQRAA